MKKYFLIFFLAFSQFAIAQKLINAVMVGDNGITEDVKKAKFLIVVKTYGDTAFERLEYNFTGPMKRRLTYKDAMLKTLHGRFVNFSPSGIVSSEGDYVDNKKDGSWYLYNDTAHAITEYKYHLDTLLAVIDLDSLQLEKKKITEDTTGEHEADYKGGIKKFSNFISQNLKIPERTQSLEAGGTVRVRFVIDKEGKVINVRIWKSVEFAFDEEALRVVSISKDWIPAIQKGRKVNAYREQPISLSFK
jgi:TonB family protein